MHSNCIKKSLNLEVIVLKNIKHSRGLLLSRRCNLEYENQIEELEFMLINYFENLRIA